MLLLFLCHGGKVDSGRATNREPCLQLPAAAPRTAHLTALQDNQPYYMELLGPFCCRHGPVLLTHCDLRTLTPLQVLEQPPFNSHSSLSSTLLSPLSSVLNDFFIGVPNCKTVLMAPWPSAVQHSMAWNNSLCLPGCTEAHHLLQSLHWNVVPSTLQPLIKYWESDLEK